MCFWLELPSWGHISPSWFRKINCLLVKGRIKLCTSTTAFKYWKGIAPSYLKDILMPSLHNYNSKSHKALDIPLCKTNKGKKSMSFLGPKIWNNLSCGAMMQWLSLLHNFIPLSLNSGSVQVQTNLRCAGDLRWWESLIMVGQPCHTKKSSSSLSSSSTQT